MAEYFLEKRHLKSSEVAYDIARHLQARQVSGKAIVVVERPSVLLSSVRRHWMQIMQTLQKEWARTLDAELRSEFTAQLKRMEELSFVSKLPKEIPEADVYFIDFERAQELTQGFQTLYFCTQPDETQKIIDKLIIDNESVVVQYLTV